MDDTIEKLNNAVPELFYDIISRITPGAIFVLILIYLWYPSFYDYVKDALKGSGLVIIVFLAYISGFLLSQVSLIIFDALLCNLFNYTSTHIDAINGIQGWMGGKMGDFYFFPRIEKITETHPEFFKKLRKLVAEKVLIENLCCAFIFTFLFYSMNIKKLKSRAFFSMSHMMLIIFFLIFSWLFRMMWLGRTITNTEDFIKASTPSATTLTGIKGGK
jgi:hypothetical protein